VDLPQGDQGPAFGAQSFQKQPAVAFDCRMRIVLGESEVEVGVAVNFRTSTTASAKGVDDPRNLLEILVVQQGYPGLFSNLQRHISIVAYAAPNKGNINDKGE